VVNGKTAIRFADGEPEDNNLSRNFSDAYSILGLIRKAYAGGKAGEALDIEEEDYEGEDE